MNVGVNLASGALASTALQMVLADAAQSFTALGPAVDGLNKQNLGDRLVPFEAIRAGLGGSARVDAAELLTRLSAGRLVYAGEGGVEIPLTEYMSASGFPVPLETHALGEGRGLVPRIPYNGSVYTGREIEMLAVDLADRCTITEAAFRGLEWVAKQDALDLTGQKFVMLGAGAELASTEILLRAGATVLFIDLSSAEKYAADRSIHSGVLVYPQKALNLLTQPREVVATIREFANGDAVHIGAFAYVGGNAMEWRLSGVMNAILRALDPSIVQSIGMYVSPTAPAQAQKEDVLQSLASYDKPSAVDRALRRIGVLKPNLLEHEGAHWPRNIVAIQKASYWAAQYLEKRLAAEVFAIRGLRSGEHHPITVSANVAGITRTRSMQIPTFQAGFLGAPTLGLETYDPETMRWLSGLLYLEGILNPEGVGHVDNRNPFEDENIKAQRLSSVQVHGAVYSHAHAIQGAIAKAALIGLRKQPSLIPGFVRSFRKKK